MVYTEDKKNLKPDIFKSLQALSNQDRMEIFKFIIEVGGKVPFNQILKKIYPKSQDKSANLSNHLGKLTKIGIIDKGIDGYYITPLGQELSQHFSNIERVFHHFNKDLMVRTSDFNLEPFDEEKLVDFLIKEAQLNKKEAQKIADIAKKRLISLNIEYFTTPLIREYLNAVLLENGYEEIRHKLTRLGLPPYDINHLLKSPEFPNITEFYNELGRNIFEQYLLLNLLPQGNADYFLSGKLFFLHPDSWALKPSELVLPGRRFVEIIINKIQKSVEKNKKHEKIAELEKNKDNVRKNISQNNIPQSQQSADDNFKLLQFISIYSKFINNLKQFFSNGVVITEFEYVVKELSKYLEIKPSLMIKYIFSFFDATNITQSYNPRHFHDEQWELWIEISINDDIDLQECIEAIINEYHSDILNLKRDKTSQTRNKSKDILEGDNDTIEYIARKPNLLVNLTSEMKEKILSAYNLDYLPPLLEKLMETALSHNISFINPYMYSKKDKNRKKILTPTLTPVSFNIAEFYGQNIISKPKIILDKTFINLPRIVQISENIHDDTLNFGKKHSNTKTKSNKNQTSSSDKGKKVESKTKRGKSAKKKNFDRFFTVLKEWVFNAMNIFDRKFMLFSKNISQFKDWGILSESIFGKESFPQQSDLLEYNGNIKIICSICLNGLVEIARYYTGLYPEQSPDSEQFVKEVISFVSDILKNNSRKSVEYVLSQPHLGNYLQIRFLHDLNLLQNLAKEYFEIEGENTVEALNSIKNIRDDISNDLKNYNITKFMSQQQLKGYNMQKIFPYGVSVFRTDIHKKLEKKLEEFHKFFLGVGDGTYLDLYLGKQTKYELTNDILKVYQAVLKNDIQNFGFCRILGQTKGHRHYRYTGCYKPLKYYEKLIRNAILQRKDEIV